MTENKKVKAMFVTGTGTDIGKTYVTGLILKKLKELGKNPAYYKAAMSGNDRVTEETSVCGGTDTIAKDALIPGDALHVKTVSGITQPVREMCPYIYENAVSPHLASRIEGNPVHMDVVKQGYGSVCENYDYVTVEGSGGILCPICFDEAEIWLEDVINALGLSANCLVIADAGLGTINNVVLTVSYMRSKGMEPKGIFFNNFIPGDVMQEDNIRMCEYKTGLRVLACIEKAAKDLDIDSDTLLSLYM